VPPTDRFVPRFAAEPPQEPLPYGRRAHRLTEVFYDACGRVDAEGEDLGEPGDVAWYPDRTYGGRTYVPATAPTANGFELYGYVAFPPGEPERLEATAEFTAHTAERHPEWDIDLNDEEIGRWRGEEGHTATVALVWGRSLARGGAIATAELADLVVDQCVLDEELFTLVAPDDYRHDLLEVRVWDHAGRELARESLYEEEAS
jgi:hypothetical protein